MTYLWFCKFLIQKNLYSGLYKNYKSWQIWIFQNFALFTTSNPEICYFYTAKMQNIYDWLFLTPNDTSEVTDPSLQQAEAN